MYIPVLDTWRYTVSHNNLLLLLIFIVVRCSTGGRNKIDSGTGVLSHPHPPTHNLPQHPPKLPPIHPPTLPHQPTHLPTRHVQQYISVTAVRTAVGEYENTAGCVRCVVRCSTSGPKMASTGIYQHIHTHPPISDQPTEPPTMHSSNAAAVVRAAAAEYVDTSIHETKSVRVGISILYDASP